MNSQPEYTKEDYKKFIHTLVDDLEDFHYIKVLYSMIALKIQRDGG